METAFDAVFPTMSPSNTALLEAHEVKVHYQTRGTCTVRAVDGVTLAVHAGETVGLVGESGCGKSSLGRAMLRLEKINAGRVVAFGEDVTALPERRLRALRRRSAMIFQDPFSSLDPRMTVGAVIAEPLFIHRRVMDVKGRRGRRERAAALLGRVGLELDALDRYPHEFSGGQRQRIVVARALATEPQVIVADEPVSALDVSIQAGVVNLLMDLQAERGLAYLFVAHDLKLVELICHRVAVMYLGRVVESGPTAAIFEDPRHPYTLALLAAIPLPDPSRRTAVAPLAGEVPSPLDPPPGCPFHPRCSIAVARCSTERPELVADAQGHAVACHEVGRPPS